MVQTLNQLELLCLNRAFRRIPIIDYTSQDLANVSTALIVDSDYFQDKNAIVLAVLMMQTEDKRSEFNNCLSMQEQIRFYAVNLMSFQVEQLAVSPVNMSKSRSRFVRFLEANGVDDYKVSIIADYCKVLVYYFKQGKAQNSIVFYNIHSLTQAAGVCELGGNSLVFVSMPDGLSAMTGQGEFFFQVKDIRLIVQAGENVVFASDYNIYIVPFASIFNEKAIDLDQMSIFKAKYRHRIVGINYYNGKILIMHQQLDGECQ